METGLNLSDGYHAISTYTQTEPVKMEKTVDFWPENDFDYEVIDNPDGSKTIILTICPFFYNSESQVSIFYQDYNFQINSETSDLTVLSIEIDKYTYDPGENVTVDLRIQSFADTPMDIVADAKILNDAPGIVDGLPIRIMRDLEGIATVSFTWDSTGFEPDNYYFNIQFKTLEGTALNQTQTFFMLGDSNCFVSVFSALPTYFNISDYIGITITCENTGSQIVDGIACIRVHNDEGTIIEQFNHTFNDLQVGNDITFVDNWDTTGQNEGTYTFTGYVTYDNKYSNTEQIIATTEKPTSNQMPIQFDESPEDHTINENRPPDELSISIDDPDDDTMNVNIYWKDHLGNWQLLTSFF